MEKLKIITELNIRVILIGIILSVVMGAANVYLGLKVGMTVSASIPASVMGMLTIKYLNKIFKSNNTNSILEANQIQTAASAGESLAAGIIFTMPALIIIGIWQELLELKIVVMGDNWFFIQMKEHQALMIM